MVSSHIASWQLDGETRETVTDFILGGFKITTDGDCRHEIKRCLLLGRKVISNLDSMLKTQTVALYQSRGVRRGGRWEGVSKERGNVYTYVEF